MNWDEIISRFPDSFVLLANPKGRVGAFGVESGEFIYKHKSKDRVLERMKAIGKTDKLLTIAYTGTPKPLADDEVICL